MSHSKPRGEEFNEKFNLALVYEPGHHSAADAHKGTTVRKKGHNNSV